MAIGESLLAMAFCIRPLLVSRDSCTIGWSSFIVFFSFSIFFFVFLFQGQYTPGSMLPKELNQFIDWTWRRLFHDCNDWIWLRKSSYKMAQSIFRSSLPKCSTAQVLYAEYGSAKWSGTVSHFQTSRRLHEIIRCKHFLSAKSCTQAIEGLARGHRRGVGTNIEPTIARMIFPKHRYIFFPAQKKPISS